MDLYFVSVLVFACILAVLVWRDRKNFKRESIFLLRRMTFGRGTLVYLGKRFPRFWKFVGFFSVLTGFVVSILGVNMLMETLLSSIASHSSTPSLALLLPSPTAEPVMGPGFLAVPFWYWIICIALLALVHEGLHGIYTAREGARIKSVGFGILAVIPLAFVEPDEKQLAKKGVWPQLRVFSAGSFANFLLAALSVFLLVLMAQSVYVPSGVDFSSYPYSKIDVSSVGAVGGLQVSGLASINETIRGFGENDTIEIGTANGTYFVKKRLLLEQMKPGAAQVIVFDDYPAARSGLEGTIKSVSGRPIREPADLSLALEEAGVGATIELEMLYRGTRVNVTLTTVPVPEGGSFVPGAALPVFALLEHAVPGSIDLYVGAAESLSGMTASKAAESYSYLQAKQDMWMWVGTNYPALNETAAGKAAVIGAELDARGAPGFIGIINVAQHSDLAAGLEPFSGPLDFAQGLLVFLFVINLGVGIVNLLPLKPLDGGKMWDIVLQRYVPKHASLMMRILGYLVFGLILANFIPFGLLF